jgi:hypothetical protein
MTDRLYGYDASGNALAYATPNDAFVAASAGDTLVQWYSDATRNPKFTGQINSGSATAKGVSIRGALPNQQSTILCSNVNAFYNWDDDVGNASVTISNLTFRLTNNPSALTLCLKFDGATSNTATVDSCRFIGGFVFAIQAYAAATTIKNCFFHGIGRPVIGAGATVVNFHNNTCIDCPSAVNIQTNGEIKNSVFLNSGAVQFPGASVVSVNNVSTGTAPGTGALSGVIYDELRMWETDLGGYGMLSPQVFPDSVLASGGVDVGLTSDINGLAYTAGTFPRGCSRGVDILPTRTRVLSTETYNGTAALTGQFINADVAYYLDGHTWGAGGTEFSGEYVCGSAPDAPVIVSGTPGDGVVVFDLTAGTDHTVSVFSRAASYADSWILAGTRAGSGTLEATGLTNGQPREFVAVSSAAGAYSLPSDSVVRIANGTAADMELILNAVAAQITAAGLTSHDGTSITAEVRMPPIMDQDESLACLVCESGEEIMPNMTGVNDGIYRVAVRLFERLGATASADAATLSKERVLIQSIRRMFPGRRLTALSDTICLSETGMESIPADMLNDEKVIATELTFEFRKRHIRGN